ncbi:MAG: sulfite oxidase-like oxidoreductase [Blastocatellia bacterium]|nr:sulfite oxidase-like oxidoreductase [Blastocatellia bacterium]
MDDTPQVTTEDGVLVSPDTKRTNRIPPGQVQTRRWPVLHAGSVPSFNPATWDFRLFGLVEQEWRCTYNELLALPQVKVKSDFHCVTTWSLLDCLWEGVSVREIVSHVTIRPEVRFVLVHSEEGWTTNMPLADFLEADCLFAWKHNGKALTPDHGYPLRLVVPRLYAWKSAKWVRGVEFLEKDEPGFWESGGYHMRGDPWTEERYGWSGPAE